MVAGGWWLAPGGWKISSSNHQAPTTNHHLLQLCRRDLLDHEGFNDIADFIIVESFDGDTAFVSLLHLADVVLEATQAANMAFKDDHIVADQAGMRGAFDR